MPIFRTGLLGGAAAALALALALPAGAAALPSGTAAMKAAAPAQATAAKYRRGHRARVVVRRYGPPAGYYAPAPGYYAPAPGYYAHFGGPDTVGSLTYTWDGYAYNRFSGQRYQTCVFDEGYGRVRPCDAGRL